MKKLLVLTLISVVTLVNASSATKLDRVNRLAGLYGAVTFCTAYYYARKDYAKEKKIKALGQELAEKIGALLESYDQYLSARGEKIIVYFKYYKQPKRIQKMMCDNLGRHLRGEIDG